MANGKDSSSSGSGKHPIRKPSTLTKCAKSSPGTGKSLAASGKAGKVGKKLVNQWEGLIQAFCSTCKQSTDQLDRNALPEKPQYLAWVNVSTSQKKGKHPSGNECYPCVKLRRRHKVKSQAELNKDMEAKPQLQDWHDERRRDIVQGTNLYAHEGSTGFETVVVQKSKN